MPVWTDIAPDEGLIYCYDGTLEGLYCCVFESFARKQSPGSLIASGAPQCSLFPPHEVETDLGLFRRVQRAIPGKICLDAQQLVVTALLSAQGGVDLCALRFLRMGFALGADVMNRLAEPCVAGLYQAERAVRGEAHLLTGFIRFADVQGYLMAEIEPKHRVLPLLADHFKNRYPDEAFVIYDRTHRQALLYHNGRCELRPLTILESPALSEDERALRRLFKTFYDRITIPERRNERCRMGHMPKRFWPHMFEMEGE